MVTKRRRNAADRIGDRFDRVLKRRLHQLFDLLGPGRLKVSFETFRDSRPGLPDSR